MKVKQTDSAKPYITQKNVILCRSGIEYYHKSEVESLITEDNKPAVEREWYREYRPANVVVKAKELCRSLPVTREHPDVFVDSHNFTQLAGGVTDNEVDVVALDGESDGEIGLKSNLTFFTEELYNYFLDNKEVSLGYTCVKHFVDNPEEVGYDIILDEIKEVNHLAITRSGRGGSSVAVIDCMLNFYSNKLGGLRPMRTGIFAWLKGKKQTDSKGNISFGNSVFRALEDCKGETSTDKAVEKVIDSCAVLKDCEKKALLVDMVKDCFDNREKALAGKDEIVKTLDALHAEVSKISLDEIKSVFDSDEEEKKEEDSEKEKKEEDSEEEEAKDSDEEKKEEDSEEEKKEEDSDEEAKDSEEEKKEEDSEEKKEDGCGIKDSAVVKAVIDSLTKGELRGIVEAVVRDTLGIKEDSKKEAKGTVIDSYGGLSLRDYESFLE